MSVNRISTRYAKSLLDLAIDQNSLESTYSDIKIFMQALQSRDLLMMLKSPIITAAKKAMVFKSIFGDKLSKLTMSFFEIVIKKGREIYLPEISQEFINQYKAHNKITTVTITSAAPLSEPIMKDITDKLLQSNITMNKIDVQTKIDPSIIGGFVVETGDKRYDASVLHKLELFKKEFANK
ncbi:MAG: ATP synthase F1 subunit delta [Saprospiraceae bacterium]